MSATAVRPVRASDVRTNLTTPAAPIAAGTVTWRFNAARHARVVGSIFSDSLAASVTITFRDRPGGGAVYVVTVPAAGAPQPANTYAWDEPVRAPYVEVEFVNGGVASTDFRFSNAAIPGT
jgi:hypothetical protein